MILNDIERAVICGKQEYRTNSDFIDAIEAAVIAKLCAGVEMPEPCIYEGDTSPMYNAPIGYTLDQLTAAIAAARVQALEDAAVIAEHENAADWSVSGQIARRVRALKGGAA